MELPSKLTRKAIKQCFDKLSEAQWDHLFEHEKKNGLHAHRVEGDYPQHAYYSTQGVKGWLLTHAHYRPSDFEQPSLPWGMTVRRHAMAG